jgi:excisionase family DNA binding protein
MNNVSHNNLPEAVQGLYCVFDEIRKLQHLLEEHFKTTTPYLQHPEFLSRKEAAKLLGVSLPTLSEWTKTGLVKGYRIASRIRYVRAEIENSMKAIRTNYTK